MILTVGVLSLEGSQSGGRDTAADGVPVDVCVTPDLEIPRQRRSEYPEAHTTK